MVGQRSPKPSMGVRLPPPLHKYKFVILGMYLRFEDWSKYLHVLDEKGIGHGGAIVKVMASEVHPRDIFGREDLFVIEMDDCEFTEDEVFAYGKRGEWSGKQIEEYMDELGLSETGKKVSRALFRFANSPETMFCQAGMELRNTEGDWLIDHPMRDLDGLDRAVLRSGAYDFQIHLDIFVDKSLKRLCNLTGCVLTEGGVEGPVVTYNESRTIGLRYLRDHYVVQGGGKERLA